LLNDRTYEEIAKIFNDRGWQTRLGNSYKPMPIMRIQERYGLTSGYDRLREPAIVDETAQLLVVSPNANLPAALTSTW